MAVSASFLTSTTSARMGATATPSKLALFPVIGATALKPRRGKRGRSSFPKPYGPCSTLPSNENTGSPLGVRERAPEQATRAAANRTRVLMERLLRYIAAAFTPKTEEGTRHGESVHRSRRVSGDGGQGPRRQLGRRRRAAATFAEG